MAKRSSTPCPRSDFISAEPKRGGSGSPGTFLPYTGGVDCPGGATNNMAYLMAVEKLAEIEVPPRAKVIRVMLAELSRIMSHLAWCGTLDQDLGQLSPERAFDIVDAVCGGRMHPNWFCIGGVAEDLPKGWDALVRNFVRYLPPRLIEYDREVMRNGIFKVRTQGVGVFSAEEAIEWGVTGPNLRACGFEWDFRKKQAYSALQFEFDIPTGRHGDCYDRGLVRIVEQCVNNMPEGQYKSTQPLACPRLKEQTAIPPDEVLGAVEGAEGNNGYYLVTDGGCMSYRTRIRIPSFAHMQMLPQLVRGRMISDVLPVLGAVDYVLALA